VLTETLQGWLPDAAARRLALVENPQTLFRLPPFDAESTLALKSANEKT
jgi:hypothetical protein